LLGVDAAALIYFRADDRSTTVPTGSHEAVNIAAMDPREPLRRFLEARKANGGRHHAH
jgi:hypothetical protein